MPLQYEIQNHQKLYFISLTTAYGVDIFVRDEYREVIIESLQYCQENKGLEIYAWCLMPSHLHLIGASSQESILDILQDLKIYTARKLRLVITDNQQENRKNWMIRLFEWAGKIHHKQDYWDIWQPNHHVTPLLTSESILEKLAYIHLSPVASGFIDTASAWIYSSARDYEGENGLLKMYYIC